MKIKLLIELEYHADTTYGDSKSGKEWFFSHVLGAIPGSGGDLILHSNEVGDEIGTVRVVDFCQAKELCGLTEEDNYTEDADDRTDTELAFETGYDGDV